MISSACFHANDHSSPAAVADHLAAELAGIHSPVRRLEAELSALEKSVAAEARARLAARLRELTASCAPDTPDREDIETSTADELFEILDGELSAPG